MKNVIFIKVIKYSDERNLFILTKFNNNFLKIKNYKNYKRKENNKTFMILSIKILIKYKNLE